MLPQLCILKTKHMTTILIPSDFTAATLQLAEQAVKGLNREVNIVLFHALDLPFYTNDLIRPEHQPGHNLVTDEFRQGCRQLKMKYPWFINSIKCKFMQGNSNALFRNWADANNIDLIIFPFHFTHTRIHPRSLHPEVFFLNSGLPLIQDLQPAHTTIIKNISRRNTGNPVAAQ